LVIRRKVAVARKNEPCQNSAKDRRYEKSGLHGLELGWSDRGSTVGAATASCVHPSLGASENNEDGIVSELNVERHLAMNDVKHICSQVIMENVLVQFARLVATKKTSLSMTMKMLNTWNCPRPAEYTQPHDRREKTASRSWKMKNPSILQRNNSSARCALGAQRAAPFCNTEPTD